MYIIAHISDFPARYMFHLRSIGAGSLYINWFYYYARV